MIIILLEKRRTVPVVELSGSPAERRPPGKPGCRSASGLLFFRTALMVLSLGAVRATGALGYTHSILGLGFAAIRGLSGLHAILICLGNSGVARSLVDGGCGAIGALGYTRSILGLGLAGIGSLSSLYAVL